jgi:hypothetical protein
VPKGQPLPEPVRGTVRNGREVVRETSPGPKGQRRVLMRCIRCGRTGRILLGALYSKHTPGCPRRSCQNAERGSSGA